MSDEREDRNVPAQGNDAKRVTQQGRMFGTVSFVSESPEDRELRSSQPTSGPSDLVRAHRITGQRRSAG